MTRRLAVAILLLSLATYPVLAQSSGTISGTVTFESSGQPTHGARLTLSPLGRTTDSAEDGRYEFRDVPPGLYDVVAHSTGMADERQRVQLTAGSSPTVDFKLRLAPVHETVTVTADSTEGER